ncbi:hypothetical protein B0J14DRAFT_586233 [Halenospora varia]|nr:hypothetical protein B0J14DRAFT_586233 [Halenospora varia]
MSAHSLVPRSDWYLPKGSDQCSDIAHEAFKLAVEKFSITFRNDGKQKDVAAHLGSIQDLRDVVKGAVDKYSADHDKPLRKWITRFSTRVMYYGNIMDVLSQHHPEYVSLAWGTMKFMFVVRTHLEASPKNLGDFQRS